MNRGPLDLIVSLPAWIEEVVAWDRRYHGDEERMGLAVQLSRENVDRGTGGPFGAAIFERESGRVVAVGVNSVVRLHNCVLHAETVAIMLAQRVRRQFSLAAPGLVAHELVSSCEPCAMCLGATLWSGVRRLVFGATRDDALAVQFEEGPVFHASHTYLRERGITIDGGVLRAEARAVLERYQALGGPIYNG